MEVIHAERGQKRRSSELQSLAAKLADALEQVEQQAAAARTELSKAGLAKWHSRRKKPRTKY